MHQNSHWWSLIIFSAYGVNLDSMLLDKVLYVDDEWYAAVITAVCFITLIFNSYNDGSFHSSGNYSLFKIELVSLWISDWIVLIPAPEIWSIPGDLCLFSFSMAISTSKTLGSDTSGSVLSISVCLTLLTSHTIKS